MTEPDQKPEESPAVPNEKLLKSLNDNLVRLALRLEQTNLAEFVDMTGKPVKMIRNNFIAGIARGVGMFLGASVMGAIMLALVTWIVYYVLDVLNWIPVIGQFTSAVGDTVKQFLQQHPKK